MKTIGLQRARKIIKNRAKLGKKEITWDVPVDLIKRKGFIVGIGEWKNTEEKFVIFTLNRNAIYIEKDTFLEIANSLKNSKDTK